MFLDNGFPTRMTFANAESGVELYFKEQEITPPGVDMGGPNDTTSMQNTGWRTQSPKTLKTLTAPVLVCRYDPAFLDGVLSLIGDNQLITITFPDTSTWAFWGWIDKFIPGNLTTAGEPGTATVNIEVSNHDDSDVEVAPVYSAPA